MSGQRLKVLEAGGSRRLSLRTLPTSIPCSSRRSDGVKPTFPEDLRQEDSEALRMVDSSEPWTELDVSENK